MPNPQAQHDDPGGSRRGGSLGTARGGGDSVDESKLLESLAEIERQVAAFKAQSAAREQEETAFASLCIELVRARDSRDSWETSWEDAQAEVEKAGSQLQTAKDALVERAKHIETLQAQLDSTNAMLDATRQQLEGAIAERNSARAERDQAKALLEEAEARHASIAGEIEGLRALAEEAKRAHEDAEAHANTLRSEIEGASAERDSARRMLDEKQARLESLEAELGASQAEREAARKELDQSRGERDAARRERDAARAERDDARKERDAAQLERDSARNDLERAAHRLESLQSELGSAHHESESTKSEYASVQSELASLRDQLASARQERDDALAALDSAQAQLGEAQAELESSGAGAEAHSEQLASLARERDEARGKIDELDAALEAARRELGDANARLESAGAGANEQAGHMEALARERDEARSKIDELTAALEANGSADGELRAALESARAEHDAAKARIDELNAALASAREDLEAARALAEEAAAAEPAAAPADDAFTRNRRERLAKYRKLVEREAEKVIQAEALLAARIAKLEAEPSKDNALKLQLDALTEERDAMRAKLEKAARAIKQLQATPQPPKVVVKKQPSRSLGAVAATLLGVSALAGVSWHMAGQFETASYIAEMRIAPETPAGQMGERERAAWLDYHETLTSDPQVLGLASERLKRRGIVSLSDPMILRERLERDLDVMRTGEGELSFTVRGEGSDQTRRMLETYVLTLVSFANDTRDYREDGASTLVAQGATAGDTAVSTNRLALFGVVAGSGLVLCAVLGLVFARLSRPSEAPVRSYAGEDELNLS